MLNPIEIKRLDWDSAFFGYKVAKLTLYNHDVDMLKVRLEELREEEYKLIYVFLKPEDLVSNQACRQTNCVLVDERITYFINKPSAIEISAHIEYYLESLPNEQLYKLAILSGENSRFKLDPHIGEEKFISLYKQWIENSVNKKIADEVLIYKNKGEIFGFVSISLKTPVSTIGLIAVDPDYQGLQIGRELVNASIREAFNHNASSIEVVTQKVNKGACRFYEKCGFSQLKIENIYHCWL